MTPLRQRMIEDMKIRNLSPNTRKRYVKGVEGFAEYFGKSPELLGAEEVRRYQLYLITDKGLSSSSVNIVVCALRFLYRYTLGHPWDIERIRPSRREKKLPIVLSLDEVMQFFNAVESTKHRVILMTAYAAGLRVSEVTQLKLTDIEYGETYRKKFGTSMSPEQLQVMHAIEICRTAVLGGHIDQCDHCGHQVISYNSCRNRHCPKCQSLAKAEWLEARKTELLPVGYYHVVFTIPENINSVVLQNKCVIYNILFKAASQTLLTIAADPKHLGAKIGFTTILHTWGQNLMFHPHLHCAVPGSGLSRTIHTSNCHFQSSPDFAGKRQSFLHLERLSSGKQATHHDT